MKGMFYRSSKKKKRKKGKFIKGLQVGRAVARRGHAKR